MTTYQVPNLFKVTKESRIDMETATSLYTETSMKLAEFKLMETLSISWVASGTPCVLDLEGIRARAITVGESYRKEFFLHTESTTDVDGDSITCCIDYKVYVRNPVSPTTT